MARSPSEGIGAADTAGAVGRDTWAFVCKKPSIIEEGHIYVHIYKYKKKYVYILFLLI